MCHHGNIRPRRCTFLCGEKHINTMLPKQIELKIAKADPPTIYRCLKNSNKILLNHVNYQNETIYFPRHSLFENLVFCFVLFSGGERAGSGDESREKGTSKGTGKIQGF